MANANISTGLLPINQNGTNWSGQGLLAAFPASQSSNIFKGDPLVPLGGSDANGVPLWGLATAGNSNPVGGVFLGISNGPAGGSANAQSIITRDLPVYRQASILNYGFIVDDPNILFAIQEDSNGGAIAAATAGFSNANLVSGAGSTVTGLSGWQLQSSSASSSANTGYQVKIIGLVRGPDNAVGVNAKWMVRLNNPSLWSTSGL